jgi:hypothetical protein
LQEFFEANQIGMADCEEVFACLDCFGLVGGSVDSGPNPCIDGQHASFQVVDDEWPDWEVSSEQIASFSIFFRSFRFSDTDNNVMKIQAEVDFHRNISHHSDDQCHMEVDHESEASYGGFLESAASGLLPTSYRYYNHGRIAVSESYKSPVSKAFDEELQTFFAMGNNPSKKNLTLYTFVFACGILTLSCISQQVINQKLIEPIPIISRVLIQKNQRQSKSCSWAVKKKLKSYFPPRRCAEPTSVKKTLYKFRKISRGNTPVFVFFRFSIFTKMIQNRLKVCLPDAAGINNRCEIKCGDIISESPVDVNSAGHRPVVSSAEREGSTPICQHPEGPKFG